MKKALAIVAATSSLAFGAACSGGSEKDANFVPSEKLLDERSAQAGNLAVEGFRDFNNRLQSGGASVTEDKNNCIFYEAPEGSAIIKNPSLFTFQKGEALIKIILYATIDDSRSTPRGIPHVYTDSELKGNVLNLDDSISMNPAGQQDTTVNLAKVEDDGNTAWFDGPNGERVSETKLLPHTPDLQHDSAAIDAAALTLCGVAIKLIPNSAGSDSFQTS